MSQSIKLENIGCLVVEGNEGLDCKYGSSLTIEDEYIASIGSGNADTVIDCKDKMVTSGFVDSHTHLVFDTLRIEEHKLRLSGASYEEIAKKGGGIVSSVESVRSASPKKLFDKGYERLNRFLSMGTTTIEAKSGYGLDVESELKSLRVINELSDAHPIKILPTFMGAHAFPVEYKNKKDEYVSLIIDKMIPEINNKGLAKFIDVFCEEGYFSVDQSKQILEAGKSAGLIPRIHADEFYNFGASFLAGEVGAISADHLMKIDEKGIQSLKENNVVATLLPGTTFFLNKDSYAPARKLIDNKITVALATDFNPGSCHIQSMPFILTLAVMKMQMSIEEAFLGATLHGAQAIGLEDEIGSIRTGKKADLIVWDISDLSEIPYYVSNHPIRHVIKNGKLVFGS